MPATATPPAHAAPKTQHATTLHPTLMEVRIDAKHLTFGPNIRDASAITQDAIDGMAASLKLEGQQQPITCQVDGDGPLTLIFGQLRVLGARKAGIETLQAQVFQNTRSPEQVERMQAAENLQREAFGLADEAVVVAKAYARKNPSKTEVVDRRAIELVAQDLGHSTKWVHERLRVSRLDAGVLKLVRAGTVTHGAAMLLCRVADPREQARLAKKFVGSWDQGSPPLLGDLREEVQEVSRSLAVVPWDRAVEIKALKGVPACLACPHNTANDTGLFELEPKDASCGYRDSKTYQKSGPYCLKPACFEKKAAWATAEVAKVVAAQVKAAKASKGKAPKTGDDNDESSLPAGISAEAVAAAIKRKVEAQKPHEGLHQTSKAWNEAAWKAQQAAARKVKALRDKWRADVLASIAEACDGKPGRLALFFVMMRSTPIAQSRCHTLTLRQTSKCTPVMAKAVSDGTAKEGCNHIGLDEFVRTHCDIEACVDELIEDARHSVRDPIAARLGITIPPKPTSRDVKAAEAAKKPAPKDKPAAGKKSPPAKKATASKAKAATEDLDEEG